MKLIKSVLSPETLFLTAIALAVMGFLPQTSIPFAFIFTAGSYLSYVLITTAKTHRPLKPRFGPVSGALFFLFFGISLLLLYDQTRLSIGAAILITFVAQMLWITWDSKYSK